MRTYSTSISLLTYSLTHSPLCCIPAHLVHPHWLPATAGGPPSYTVGLAALGTTEEESHRSGQSEPPVILLSPSLLHFWINPVNWQNGHHWKSLLKTLKNIPWTLTVFGKTAFGHFAPWTWNQLQNKMKLNCIIPLDDFKFSIQENLVTDNMFYELRR